MEDGCKLVGAGRREPTRFPLGHTQPIRCSIPSNPVIAVIVLATSIVQVTFVADVFAFMDVPGESSCARAISPFVFVKRPSMAPAFARCSRAWAQLFDTISELVGLAVSDYQASPGSSTASPFATHRSRSGCLRIRSPRATMGGEYFLS